MDLIFRVAPGGIRFDISGDDERLDADPSLGGELRFDIPVAKRISLGPAFSVYTVRPKNSGIKRQPVFDIDPFLKIRGVRGRRKRVELYGLVHGGVSLVFLREAYRGPGDDKFTAGWNIGFMPGARLIMGRRFGLIFEFGYMRTQWKTNSTRLAFNQGVFRVGLSF